MAETRQVAPAPGRDLATMPFLEALESFTPNFAAALPSHIPIERFKRMVVTAVNQNPDLVKADRRTLFNACVKCAHDGLFPDGREAALVVYKTKIKVGGQDQWIEAVQYLPMIAGIRKRMRNTGGVLSAEAQVVYRNDKFHREFGDSPTIMHEPPPLDQERGEPVGAYAIIKLSNGEVLREVMSVREIERVRAVSRSGQMKGAPWMEWWDEMARKTVLKRCAKAAPTASDLERLIGVEDEPETPRLEDLAPIPPRPTRGDFIEHDNASTPAPEEEAAAEPTETFSVIDFDGVETETQDAARAVQMLSEIFAGAAKIGLPALTGTAETNKALLEHLATLGMADELRAQYVEHVNALKPSAEAAGEAPDGEKPSEAPTPPQDETGHQAPSAGAQPARSEWYDQQSLAIEPRKKNGRQDWQTWFQAQFLPRLRGAATVPDLSHLLGDNQRNIEDCKQALGLEAARELDVAVKAQWTKVPA